MNDIRDFDAMLDEWERLIVLGQHGAALDMVENALSEVPSAPPLYDLQRMVPAPPDLGFTEPEPGWRAAAQVLAVVPCR